VKYKDGILYVMDHDDGLGFVNIEDPENPDVVGFYELPGAGTSVAVEGNLAYVTDNENGLIIIDVSEIDNPVELGSIETSAPAIDVCVHDTIAFVAMRHAGLDIINISNPEDPIRIISVDTPGHAVSVTYNNGLVCVADGSGGLRLFDASNPNDTEEIAFYDTPGSAAGVKIRDEYVFVADAESGLLILNICDFLPRSPQISFSPESLEFSAVTLEESSDLILTISNEGDADLTVTDITTEAPFSVAFEGEFTVEPEGSVEVTVTFAPEEFGVFEGNLTITSNDPDAEETLVELSGFGLEEQDFELADGVTYTMVKIPAGSFMMGSPDDEQGRRDDESPVHEVNIPNPLWVGKYEVTQSQWQVIMGENPAENYGEGDNYPVYDINWTQIDEFENTAGNGFRLPSESEWEYFCRAGTESRFYWGDDHGYESITNYAWYQGNGENTTHPVGTLEPNWWGLFDVVGNVWEKCEDNYHNSYENAPNDGSFWIDNGDENQRKVSRGGGFPTAGEYCRSAGMRRDNYLNYDDYDEGFRLVRDLDFDIVENKILPDDGEANDLFGQEVDISGDYAIVGAFQDDDNAENSGSAYIFNRTNNGWIQQAKLNADDAEAVDYFGYDVSINGDYAIVGALNDDDNGDNSGSAYIFVRDGENWSQQAKLTASDAAAVDVFGSSVSL
ncbi:SUMF1/EgtB/PvdO family nonheme iron enzyme, partial [bacterium]|nr:SUMF1/EgtB/PvdO family nonheme iron enzyme [bacterium]